MAFALQADAACQRAEMLEAPDRVLAVALQSALSETASTALPAKSSAVMRSLRRTESERLGLKLQDAEAAYASCKAKWVAAVREAHTTFAYADLRGLEATFRALEAAAVDVRHALCKRAVPCEAPLHRRVAHLVKRHARRVAARGRRPAKR